MQTTVECPDNAVLALDGEGRILCLNKAAEHWLGERAGSVFEDWVARLGLRELNEKGKASRWVRRQPWRSADGRVMEMEVEASCGELEGRRIYLLVVRNVSLWDEMLRRLGRKEADRASDVRLREAAGRKGPSETARQASRRAKILVVDDEELVRKVVAAVLRHGGYDVVEVRSGLEAVQQVGCGAFAFDLVLMDVNMPGLNGREALQQIRRHAPGMGAILLSGDLEEAAGETHPALDGVEFFQKPFDSRELLERVRAKLEQSRAARGG